MTELLRGIRRDLYTHVFKPVLDRRAHGLARRMARFARAESLGRDELAHRQWEALEALLTHAYDSCPFYKSRFDSLGLRPQDIRTPQDFATIPPLTREDLRQNPEGLLSSRFPREGLQQAATGGTTDTPIPFYRDLESLREKTALHHRFNQWAGMENGDRVFYLWGAASDYAAHPSWRWKLYERYVLRQIFAPASPLSSDVFAKDRALLNQFQPRVIYAYPTPLALFAEYLLQTGLPYHRPQSVICTAEALMGDQRQVIEAAFDCRVFQFYGAREFGIVAAECEQHSGLHWNPMATRLDVAPLAGGGEEGLQEIFVTDLLGRAMPLIRYRVNDCAEMEEQACPCGRAFPRLRKITGRVSELFVLPNGALVPGVTLTGRILKVCPSIKKTQIIQETRETFTIRYIPGPGFEQTDLDRLRGNLRNMLGDGLSWTFESVTDIPRERSGKTRFCISRVAR